MKVEVSSQNHVDVFHKSKRLKEKKSTFMIFIFGKRVVGERFTHMFNLNIKSFFLVIKLNLQPFFL